MRAAGWWVGGLLLVAAGAGVYRWQSGVSGAASSSSAAGSAEARRAAAKTGGDHLRYSLTYGTEVVQGGTEPVLELKLSGTLELVLVERTPEAVRYRARYQGTLAASRGQKPEPALAAAMKAGLDRPFYIEQDPRSQLKSLAFERGVMRTAQTLLRSIAGSLQFVRGSSKSNLWQSDELDENGAFVAQYERKEEGGFSKQKLRYVRSHAENVQHRILDSTSRVWLDQAGRVQKVSSGESIGALSSNPPMPELRATSTVELKLTAVDRVQVESAWLDELASFDRMGLDEAGTRASIQTELDRARAGKMAFPDALATLREALAGKKEQEGTAFNALMAHVRQDSTRVAALVAEIRAGGPLKNQLISVLRDAGTPEAQAALRELLQEQSLEPADRLQIVRGLSRVDQPTSETVATLEGLVDDRALGEQAQLGLGGNVYRLQRSNPELAERALGVVQKRLEAAPNDSARITLLRALGNAGAPTTLSTIEPYLSSPNEALAIAATQALQRIPGPSVDLLLVKQLRQATSPRVRIQAAETIRYREVTPVLTAALIEAMKSDTDPAVRRAVMDATSQLAFKNMELRQALVAAASNDPSADLRAHAQKLVSAL